MIKLLDLYSGNKFDPAQIIADGYTGVIFKGGQGAWADVPRYQPTWWELAAQHGLYRGWYWLCDSRHEAPDHITEMKHWKIFQDVGELGIWIDMEKPVLSMTERDYWKTPYAGYRNVVDFSYLIRTEGFVPGIYTGPGAYELIMRGAPSTAHEYLGTHELWTAQYPYKYDPNTSKPTMYGEWTTWTWWQYREGPDINLFNGTNDEFIEKYGDGVIVLPPEEPPITGDDTMAFTKKGVAKANTNIKMMGGAGNTIATLQKDWYIYGDVGATDMMNFTHYYQVGGIKKDLGQPCKAILSNLTVTDEVEPGDVVVPPVDPPVDTMDMDIRIHFVNEVVDSVIVDGETYKKVT